jgi:hypothetical protein
MSTQQDPAISAGTTRGSGRAGGAGEDYYIMEQVLTSRTSPLQGKRSMRHGDEAKRSEVGEAEAEAG